MSKSASKNDFNPSEEYSQNSVLSLFRDHFTEYASYVILDRAVPHTWDGLKPVQRRIMHSLQEMDDGRFNKVANIVGHTMRYHPHGDMAIGDALVNLANKDLLIEKQGNYGDPYVTGFRAASSRYIEARLSKFAKKVLFNKKLTAYVPSYDGRSMEPVQFPAKFPLVLAQGVEGIAVGLSTKILPHNFNELIDASIAYLRNKPFSLLPDFPTAAMMDATGYNDGKKGGKIKLRADIEVISSSELAIRSLPFETTTESLIESIVKANESGKIKLKRVEDRSSDEVDVRIYLDRNTPAETVIKPLYAFTKAENSISVNACIIDTNDKPIFTSVSDILKMSAERTKDLIRQELEIRIAELTEKLYFMSLEQIFITKKVYQVLEKAESWQEALGKVRRKMLPFTKELYRELTEEDVEKLCEIKIKRIAKFDVLQAEEAFIRLEGEREDTEDKLAKLTNTVVKYLREIKKEFGKEKERRTQISDSFDVINKKEVVNDNVKLYVNKKEGFIGYGSAMRKEELIGPCSDMDSVVVMFRDGGLKVVKIDAKQYVGHKIGDKEVPIVYCGVLKPGDDITTYNILYLDGGNKRTYAKRFILDKGFSHGRDYALLKAPKSQVLYVDVTATEEEQLNPDPLILFHREKPRIKKQIEFNFADVDVKTRSSAGTVVTPHLLKKIKKIVLARGEEDEES